MLGWLFGKKQETPEFKPVVVRKEVVVEAPKKPTKPAKPEKTKYVCDSCGYRFTRASHIEVNGCPYCGKKDIQVDQSGDAQKLIESAQEVEERYEFR